MSHVWGHIRRLMLQPCRDAAETLKRRRAATLINDDEEYVNGVPSGEPGNR